jgi:hypothetical protein
MYRRNIRMRAQPALEEVVPIPRMDLIVWVLAHATRPRSEFGGELERWENSIERGVEEHGHGDAFARLREHTMNSSAQVSPRRELYHFPDIAHERARHVQWWRINPGALLSLNLQPASIRLHPQECDAPAVLVRSNTYDWLSRSIFRRLRRVPHNFEARTGACKVLIEEIFVRAEGQSPRAQKLMRGWLDRRLPLCNGRL